MKNGKLMVISGPTASGKTQLAYQLAQAWNCPILSADSRQIYKEVDIGTGKPPQYMLESVTHHFINHVPVDGSYSVGQFETETLLLINQLFENHKTIILCGGTGLYLQAIVKGLDALPPSDDDSRRYVQYLLEEGGLTALQERLKSIDPGYYDEVDLNNLRRVSRALEVYHMTGKPFSSFRIGTPIVRPFQIRELCLMPDRETLYYQINQRVLSMIQMGWIEEAKRLSSYQNCHALASVGYPEIFNYLRRQFSLEETIALIQQKSRNYAKRQITWFRKTSLENFVDPKSIDVEELMRSM